MHGAALDDEVGYVAAVHLAAAVGVLGHEPEVVAQLGAPEQLYEALVVRDEHELEVVLSTALVDDGHDVSWYLDLYIGGG